jgi:hypothetical protein
VERRDIVMIGAGFRGTRAPALLLAVMLGAVTAAALSAPQLPRQVVGAGGGSLSGGAISLAGTVGQSVVGLNGAAGAPILLRSGFWQPAAVVTAVAGEGVPPRPQLVGNVPNPFNPRTEILFAVGPQAQRVKLLIYDVKGRLISTLLDEVVPAGAHRAVWRGRGSSGEQVASGSYFCRLVAGEESFTRKMLLVK